MSYSFAPVVLFVYNRPEHTKNILDSLALNEEAGDTTLYVYSDGPKDGTTNEGLSKIKKVREIVADEFRFKQVKLIIREKNLGLSPSIISGVSEVIERHGSVIVLEDDLIVSRYFLKYMNEALKAYENVANVGQIGACNFFACSQKYPPYFFTSVSDCLGWATWKDRWQHFNANGVHLMELIKRHKLEYLFNVHGSYDMIGALNNQINGVSSSWSVRWQAVCLLNNWLTLYPNPSHTNHIGSTDYTHATANIIPPLVKDYIPVDTCLRVEESPQIKRALKLGYAGLSHYSGSIKLSKIIGNRLKKIKNRYRNLFKSKAKVWQLLNKSWEEIERLSDGYSDQSILNRCKLSTELIRDGVYKYERDTVLFDKIEYSWPLLAGLQAAALEHEGSLTVLDFGGSLGSTYYQNKSMLSGIKSLKWCVVEQKHFVDFGKANFENDVLKFYFSIDQAIEDNVFDVVILSSVLQYIKDPHLLIDQIANLKFKYIIIDRTSFSHQSNDLLTIQNVPSDIYNASYPCWFFSLENFLSQFPDYILIADFDSFCDPKNYKLNKQTPVFWKGFIFKKLS